MLLANIRNGIASSAIIHSTSITGEGGKNRRRGRVSGKGRCEIVARLGPERLRKHPGKPVQHNPGGSFPQSTLVSVPKGGRRAAHLLLNGTGAEPSADWLPPSPHFRFLDHSLAAVILIHPSWLWRQNSPTSVGGKRQNLISFLHPAGQPSSPRVTLTSDYRTTFLIGLAAIIRFNLTLATRLQIEGLFHVEELCMIRFGRLGSIRDES